MEKQDVMIAVYDGYAGIADSLELAFADLQNTLRSDIDVNEIDFYKSQKIKVEMQLVEIDEKSKK